jgi:ATP-dependent exoDNAse (exonuclease V) alpha subunit
MDDENLGQMMANLEEEIINSFEEENNTVENDMEMNETVVCNEDNFEEDVLMGNVRVDQFLLPRAIDDNAYRTLMRTLNEKQRRFVLNSLHLLKTTSAPFYYFLSGGAGVGKSQAINAIVQSYIRYCGNHAAYNLENYCVIVGAPTGKAAFNVFGTTLHSISKLPPTQYNGKLCDLDDGALSSLRRNLCGVKLFIIDEISMVSVKMLYEVDQRLRQVYASPLDFGGRSITVVSK